MKASVTRDALEVSDAFFNDGMDLLARYRLTKDSFWDVKSRRLKLFIDLRMAYECILKAYIAFFRGRSLGQAALIKKVESFRHSVDRLAEEGGNELPGGALDTARRLSKDLAQLPMALRYKLDGFDFLSAKEQLYYRTIGSDSWLIGLEENVIELTRHLNDNLQAHSRMLSGSELWELILEEKHSK